MAENGQKLSVGKWTCVGAEIRFSPRYGNFAVLPLKGGGEAYTFATIVVQQLQGISSSLEGKEFTLDVSMGISKKSKRCNVCSQTQRASNPYCEFCAAKGQAISEFSPVTYLQIRRILIGNAIYRLSTRRMYGPQYGQYQDETFLEVAKRDTALLKERLQQGQTPLEIFKSLGVQ